MVGMVVLSGFSLIITTHLAVAVSKHFTFGLR